MEDLLDFYRKKKILITGHTGFKGSWMCQVLSMLGADVIGYALDAPTNPSLFYLTRMQEKIKSVKGDIRDLERLKKVFLDFQPEIVFHMAAQPLVRTSYEQPVYTYDVNVMGTVNVLECVRLTKSVKSVINVTTDKVYRNYEWERGYKEEDELNGFDPYSNSKSCSELVTDSYKNSFLNNTNIAVSTMRAGNVLGGGDFARDRIIPDCIRAALDEKVIVIRNPYSIRPYQHVLEPVIAYLLVAKKQYEDINFSGAYNVGPKEEDCVQTGRLADIFCDKWEMIFGKKVSWQNKFDGGPHEASFLKLDCKKISNMLFWEPKWNIYTAITKVIEWEKTYQNNDDVTKCMSLQIQEYLQMKD